MIKLFKILTFLLLSGSFVIPMHTSAQIKKDSLLFALNITTSEFNRTEILLKIASIEINEKNYTQGKKYAQEALQLSIKNNLKQFQAESFYLLGSISFTQKDVETSIDYFTRSLNIYENGKDFIKGIELNEKIAEVYLYLGAYTKVAEYYKNCYLIADSISDQVNRIVFLEKMAEAYFNSKDYTNAEKCYLKIQGSIPKEKRSDYRFIKLLYSLSEIYKQSGKYEKALEQNVEMYTLYSEMADTLAMSVLLNNMGYLYLILDNSQNALESFRNALQMGMIAKISDKEYASLYTNIAICYQNLRNYDYAITYLKLALEALKDLNNYYEMARLENITAMIYFDEKDLHHAEIYSKSSIASAKKSGDQNLLQTCYLTYSKILREGNDHIKALEFYERHLSLRDSLLFEQRIEEQELAQKVYNLEKTEKELKLKLADEEVKNLALSQLQLGVEKREGELQLLKSEKELEQSEKERLQQSLELSKQRLESEIQDRELRQLEQDKRIQDLVLKQKEAEEKKNQKEIELQRIVIETTAESQKRERTMLALIVVIGILILMGLVQTRRKNKVLGQQKIEIENKNYDLEQKNEEVLTQSERIIQQKDLIEKKNEEITDSIHYARRIQNAVLPSIDVMEKYLDEFFIFFKPKDIVSGDFYWAAEKNDKLVVTAADCTGHGVPGAFMSMLGMSFLNEIVLKEKTLEADKILNKLRSEIIQSLKQSGKDDEAKDGMDMALCVIDKKNKKLQFAGANNPMYLIRDEKLEKVAPDRMPISLHFRSDNLFSKKDFDLLTNDVIYIFSDGYADQFGGENMRKLKYQPFQNLLFGMHTKPMSEQKDKLEKFFVDWKGECEQIDDVLVIGMRI